MNKFRFIRTHVFLMTQVEFAQAMRVSQSAVAYWESGKKTPRAWRLKQIEQLAKSEGVALAPRWLLEGPTAAEEEAMRPTDFDEEVGGFRTAAL